MSNQLRIQEALENAEANIELLATYSDAELAEKLDTIHLQTDIAAQKNNTASLQLLEIWRSQIIAARIYKAENNIPDAPSEIELAIADIETTVARSEERQEALEEYMNQVNPKPLGARSKNPEKEKDENQLSMF